MTWSDDNTTAGRYNSEALVAVLEPVDGIPWVIPIEQQSRTSSARAKTDGTDYLRKYPSVTSSPGLLPSYPV